MACASRCTPFCRFNDCDLLQPVVSEQQWTPSGSSTKGSSGRILPGKYCGKLSSNGVVGTDDCEDIVLVSSSMEKHVMDDILEDGEGIARGIGSIGG